MGATKCLYDGNVVLYTQYLTLSAIIVEGGKRLIAHTHTHVLAQMVCIITTLKALEMIKSVWRDQHQNARGSRVRVLDRGAGEGGHFSPFLHFQSLKCDCITRTI